METFGRERRHRYYTVAAFRALVAREGLDDSAATYADIDHAAIGGFASSSPSIFYDDEKALASYADSFKGRLNAGNRKHKLKNPIMPDGSVKIGRPRKRPANGPKERMGKPTTAAKADRKRKRENDDQEDADNQDGKAPVKRKRGRPPKKPRLDVDTGVEGIDQICTQGVEEQGKAELISPRKRGRPTWIDQPANSDEVPPKKRSRSAKQRQTSPPRIVDSDQPPTQTSNNDAETIIPPNVPGVPPELGNASVANNIASSSQILPEEVRRSPTKRKAVFPENNSFPRKQTPPKTSVVPGIRGGSMLLVGIPQDRNVSLTTDQIPQSSVLHSAVPLSSFTVASVASMEAEGHRDVPEQNVDVNTTVTYA